VTSAARFCHSVPVQGLSGRWVEDVRSALPRADEAAVAAVGRDLLTRWDEPHRRYHGPTHLAEVLAAVDLLAREGSLPAGARTVARLAAWFHDAVYTVGGADDSERRSAAMARESLALLGAGAALVEAVATAVLDTERHELGDGPRDPARTVLHDADLWILAAPTPRFDEYCAQVRAEYGDVPPADYAAGRSAVLRPFLVRGHVYLTDHARRGWEDAARENLARELTRLAG
jgi:predicted metal-dependent HD superfamily phosphohydrolase